MRRRIFKQLCGAAILVGAGLLGACSSKEVTANYGVIPLPQSVELTQGDGFRLDGSTVIAVPAGDSTLQKNAELFAGYLKQMTGKSPKIVSDSPAANAIVLKVDLQNENPEAYEITVGKDAITVNGASAAGNFYGLQTLRKSIPESGDENVIFPSAKISDYPRFAYRGAHFDSSRHFFGADSVKVFIDMLALHNINRMHWHLTDDQGWRVEIKSLPELTEKGSMRSGTAIGRDLSSSDSIPYGGFYTQDEIRDVIKYAADRHITIIPEIDMPGHMLAALTAYPELGCTGGPYEVWTRWGVSEDVLCAGNDSVLTFIDTVLGEITDLFPSEYIHVGGDECPKVRWEACVKCQAKAKALGLKANEKGTVEQQLQSYIIHHASDFLTSKGRKMIGWDETLEGGLAPGAIVMSWRGEEGGRDAARLGHDAIMTPTSHMYFDYYQTLDFDSEPLAFSGYVPLEKVYGFDPIPYGLTAEEGKHIIGVQANLWTEYIPTMRQAEYMELPRMAALSEVQWSSADKRDYDRFIARLPQLLEAYDAMDLNYAKHVFDVSGKLEADPANKRVNATLSTVDGAPIHYTLDGSDPTEQSPVYDSPIAIDKSTRIKGAAFRKGKISRIYSDTINVNKATFKNITLKEPPHRKYTGNGAETLVDGMSGTGSFSDGKWLGFNWDDMDATIDLGEETEISEVAVRVNIATGSWIFDATELTVETSTDGKTYKQVAHETYPDQGHHSQEIKIHAVTFPAEKARYVRVVAGCLKRLPSWFSDLDSPGFVFVDEIMIN